MQRFREIDARDLKTINLSQEMHEYGYVMIRGLLSRDHLNPLLSDIICVLEDMGWLSSESDPIERIAYISAACAEGDTLYKTVYNSIFNLQSFHSFPHHSLLQETMKLLVGPELFVHPKTTARLIFPNFERGVIHAHQDHTAVGGDEESFTAWMPLHDCPLEQGPLRVMEGSHRFGLQPTADRTGYIMQGMERGNEWVGGNINAGDVLFFHSLTVHEAMPNRSNRLRISLDCRFQNYQRPVNPGTLVFTGSSKRSWEDVYNTWTSDELKYYWTKIPLALKPSKCDLAKLAETAESPRMRARYARILERIEEQLSVRSI
jgi:ectoine hydroxylase-related dioxygenase (phytanoyl-CoA dioxygenase family)